MTKITKQQFLYLSVTINLFNHPLNQEAYQIQYHNLLFSFKSWSRLEPLPCAFFLPNPQL